MPELKTIANFYEGQFATISIDGKVIQRKVYYSKEAGDLFIWYKGKPYFLYEFDK